LNLKKGNHGYKKQYNEKLKKQHNEKVEKKTTMSRQKDNICVC